MKTEVSRCEIDTCEFDVHGPVAPVSHASIAEQKAMLTLEPTCIDREERF